MLSVLLIPRSKNTNNIYQSFGESNLETISMINGTVVDLPNPIFMKSGKYQIVAVVTVFSLGFMSHDFISDGPTVDDVYYQDTPELLQCTINLDCDNSYDWGLLFSGEEVSQYMHLLEYPEELKQHSHPRM